MAIPITALVLSAILYAFLVFMVVSLSGLANAFDKRLRWAMEKAGIFGGAFVFFVFTIIVAAIALALIVIPAVLLHWLGVLS
jgi:hypothetical protein